jgi:NADH-quinone oxidoreductase subunit L
VVAGLPGAGAASGYHESAEATSAPAHVAEAGAHANAAAEGATEHGGGEHEGEEEEHGGGGVETATHYSTLAEWGFVAIAVLVAVGGIGLAYYMYRVRLNMPGDIAASVPLVYRLIHGKYYVDELYEAVVLKPFYGWCAFFSWLDRIVVDGAVNGARHVTIAASYVSSFFDRWVVDLGVERRRGLRPGRIVGAPPRPDRIVQNYAAAMIFGSFVLLGIYLVYSR